MTKKKKPLNAWLIRWQGKPWIYGSKTLKEGGFIATRKQYVEGEISQAHLGDDGIIRRYGKDVGTRKDIALVRRIALPEPNEEAAVMFGLSMLDYFCDGPPRV